MKLNAAQLRKESSKFKIKSSKLKKNEIYIVLDNVLDTYNIGSIFRLADATASKKIYLCGATETPPNSRIKKASINTTEWVEWEYCETAVEAIRKIKKQSTSEVKKMRLHLGGVKTVQIVAIEQVPNSIQYNKFEYKLPICLIVGNETNGISKEVLDMCDATLELPMYGVNISLNVMVCLGIALYQVIEDTSSANS